ncbi:MAG TPA: hypothetical protein VLT83_09655 [Opitutaceae bacterium]|jgi:hypothetical protein|nr:hypothetical protein [Opitutaceae bacterium]
MWIRIRQILARQREWLWRREEQARRALALRSANKALAAANKRYAARRARFWNELREGQSEADALCARDP